MKYVQGISSRGTVKNDMRCALLMSEAEREIRESVRLSTGRNITYVKFNYTPVPAIERPTPVDTACNADYWNPAGYGHVKVTHLAPRCRRVTYGTAALRAAVQAKVRELMATRASARRAEWVALQAAMVSAA